MGADWRQLIRWPMAGQQKIPEILRKKKTGMRRTEILRYLCFLLFKFCEVGAVGVPLSSLQI
jgi:hypothetical protein